MTVINHVITYHTSNSVTILIKQSTKKEKTKQNVKQKMKNAKNGQQPTVWQVSLVTFVLLYPLII